MVGLGKPKLYAQVEDASCSRCTNIKGEPQILRTYDSRRRCPLFVGVILQWAFANPSCIPNLKTLASSVSDTLKETPKSLGAPQTRAMPTFSVGWDSLIRVGKPQLLTRFEVARCSHSVNTEGEPSNIGELHAHLFFWM